MAIACGCYIHWRRGLNCMDKRILIFSTSYFPEVGGAEVALREITNRLTDYSFVLICAKHQSGLLKRERIGRVDVHRVGLGMSFDRYLLPFLGPLLAVRLVSNQTLVWSMMAGYAGFAGLFYCWLRPKTIFLLTLQEGHPFCI